MLNYRSTVEVAEAYDWQKRFADRIALVGTAMLIRRGMIETIGVLDERFFAYWEDIDYSIWSIKAGFRNVVALDATVFHRSGPALEAANEVKPHYRYYMARNEILLWKKYGRSLNLLRSILWTTRRQLHLVDMMPNAASAIDAVLAGVWDGCRGIGGEYDPARRMPQPLRNTLAQHPRFWLRLQDATPGSLR